MASHSTESLRNLHRPSAKSTKASFVAAKSARTWPSMSSTLHDALMPAAIDGEFEKFLQHHRGVLTPPAVFSWQGLRDFVKPVKPWESLNMIATYPVPKRCLYDHTVWKPENPSGNDTGDNQKKDLGVQRHVTECPCIERSGLDEHMLLEKYESSNVHPSETSAQRTVLFTTDITPAYVAIIATKADPAYRTRLREFLQGHLTGIIDFTSFTAQGHADVVKLHPRRHNTAGEAFAYSFHLSYVAVRRLGETEADPRGLREWTTMIQPFFDQETTGAHTTDLACYDAEISLLVVGKSETDWNAFCHVDTWYHSEQTVEAYLAHNQDAPSGGARSGSEPCKNPREYFLLVLAQRLCQCSNEWGNVFTALMKRLDTYESHYMTTIDTADLHDDAGMSRTRSYSKAASMLRQYHDTLSATLDSLDAFLEKERHFIDHQQDFEDQCGCYLAILSWETRHLRRWRRRLFQRMQRFDTMRDGLLNASNLRESRRSTKRGDDIGLLTNVTVIYLPFSLASAILGMSTTRPSYLLWVSWVGISIILGYTTFRFAFGDKFTFLAGLNRGWRKVRSMLRRDDGG